MGEEAMKIVEPGHVYALQEQDGGDARHLTFVNREPGHEHPGVQTQEVLRALIDRTYHCDNCLPDDINADIIHHLQMALVFHEMRALRRKAEKGLYRPQSAEVGSDGHFLVLQPLEDDPLAAPRRAFPERKLSACTYRSYGEKR